MTYQTLIRTFCLLTVCFTLSAADSKLPDTHIDFPIGVTKSNKPIQSLLSKESLQLDSAKKHVLLVFGNAPGEEISQEEAIHLLQRKQTNKDYTLSVISDANPDDVKTPSFPPKGRAYSEASTAAAHYLWRFIGNHGFDLVIDLRKAKNFDRLAGGRAPGLDSKHVKLLKLNPNQLEESSFAVALTKHRPANVSAVPAFQLNYPQFDELKETLDEILKPVSQLPFSPARKQLQALVARSPIHTAQTLAKHYGHNSTIAYIPALAQLARLHLSKLADAPEHYSEVVSSLRPYAEGKKAALNSKVSGVNLAGHLTLAELAKLENSKQFTKLIDAAAMLAIKSRGNNPKSPVAGHNQMSDSVFMVCPILAAAYSLTQNPEYLQACLSHLAYLKEIDLQKDGIYRHSPQDESAWGRGNGFPALGLALTLSWLKDGTPEFQSVQQDLRNHLNALIQHQDASGLWHQVIDRPESYRELTSSCMITFAIARGIRLGWLKKETYLPVVEKSWPAINRRIGTNGELLDVCTGTGKQKSLRNYFDRTAILGKDSRGGAMALMASTEMAALYNFLKKDSR